MKAQARDLLILLASHLDHELYELAMDPTSWLAKQLGDDLVYRRLNAEPAAGSFLRGYLLERALGTDTMLRDRHTVVSRTAVDRESSASRQHFIDTGRYLTHAETAEYSS